MSDEVLEGDVLKESTTPEDGAAAAGGVAEEAPPTLEEQLQAAEAEASRNLDGWLRAQAELANARKRYEKQRADTYAAARAEAVRKLLPVLDDFERAMESVPDAVREDGWFEGIVLVHRKLTGILEHFEVQVIEAVGQPFDPNLHEAIMQEETDSYESGTVSRELQKGYQMRDQVIRPALVYVAS